MLLCTTAVCYVSCATQYPSASGSDDAMAYMTAERPEQAFQIQAFRHCYNVESIWEVAWPMERSMFMYALL
jgi:hypothetical protein